MSDEPESASDRIAALHGVTWEWRDEAPDDARRQAGMGVLAQEVERVFPELVTTDEQGRKRVDYLGLFAPLIEAVKELDQRVRALEEQAVGKPAPPP
jgi:hypothetical protein